jgi:uncharacterized membrane protein
VPYSGAFQTTPTGINDSEQIAGFYLTGALVSHGFLLNNGAFSTYDFTTADCCTDFHAINNLNQVVGYGGTVSFLFAAGTFSTISVPGSTFTSANGINDAGQIAGETIVSNVEQGFLLTGSSFTLIPNVDRATGINNAGQIVGTVGTHGYLLSGGALSTFDFPGALNTAPFGINNEGEIVGWYQATDLSLHGFALDQGAFSEIDVPGSTDTQVFGINNEGQIVGLSDGHGFLATPTPEPRTLPILAACLLGLFAITRRRKRA